MIGPDDNDIPPFADAGRPPVRPVPEPGTLFRKRAVLRMDTPLLVPGDGDHHGAPHVAGLRILRPLGQGLTGESWLAERESDRAVVVVKKGHVRADLQPTDAERRFGRLMRVSQQNRLSTIHEMRIVDGSVIAVSAHHPSSLAEWLEENRRVDDIAMAAGWFEQMAVALHLLHAKGIIHGDLHCDNVLLNSDGHAVLTDFGRHLIVGPADRFLGKALFMPPEQAVAAGSDQAAVDPDTSWDIFALGAVMYTLLCGVPPFQDAAPDDWILHPSTPIEDLEDYRNRLSWNPPRRLRTLNEDLDPALAALVEACLATAPEERCASAAQLVIDLRARANNRPISLMNLPPGATFVR